MASSDGAPTHRRRLLQTGIALSVPVLLSLGAPRAKAAVKAAKGDVGYQYTPRGAQHCGVCSSFVPGGNPIGPGSCKLVDGVIPQDGWCSLFTKR